MINKLARYLLLPLTFLIIVGLIALLSWTNPESEKSEQTSPPPPTTGPAKVGLTFLTTDLGNPTAIVSTSIPGDKRLFVVDRAGVIRTLNKDFAIETTPLLDIKNKVQAEGEMGLLGLAFHPDFKNNGFFFVNYVDKSRNTIIARFKLSADGREAAQSSEKVILKIPQPYPNHNGGDLTFGPDKYLYIALGDGGSGGDPQNRSQNPNELLGKILRVDINTEDSYKIPADNPFVGKTGTRPEIWSLGWRNPWRFSFDRKTGQMWIADVGQGEIEEINIENAKTGGKNYGWRCYEGSLDYNLSGCPDKGNYVFPAFEYDHSLDRCSVTGGYVYRGQKYPQLIGKYFYADFCTGEVFLAENKGGKWQSTLVVDAPYKISAFGQDSAGELYLADFETGSIYQLTY